MRYAEGHKGATRRHIIEVAARRYREDGVAAAGMAGLMSDAGLTNGAFYTHFESKEELVREALVAALDQRTGDLRAGVERGEGLEAWVRGYLSPRHRDSPGRGCATAALGAEIARRPRATRVAFARKLGELIDLIAGQLQGSPAHRRRRAIAMHGVMIGTLQLARAVTDRRLSDEILASGVGAALALARGASADIESMAPEAQPPR
jgi:TetR/AcrR family transcriptional regulator, transcriptional repressor for nem operon